MLNRVLGAAACLLALTFAVVSADEVKGRVKKVDSDKGTLTLTVNDKDQTFTIPKEAKIVGLFGKKIKKAQLLDIPGGLTGVKEGVEVTVTTDKKDNKDVVSQVKVEELMAKKKKKKTTN
jgi:Cu/Ag efflux protein CusF